jgi:hypothetical protein
METMIDDAGATDLSCGIYWCIGFFVIRSAEMI